MSNEIQIPLKNGLCFAAKIWGLPSKCPLIALHGWLDNANSFLPLAPYLQNDYFFIAVDLIGHGLSDHLPSSCHYHFIDSVDHVLSIANYFGFEQFSLLGHSMGAAIAPIVASTFPEKIKELFLIEGIGPLVDVPENATLRLRKYSKLSQRGRNIKTYNDLNDAINTRVRNSTMTFTSAKLIVERGMCFKNGIYHWRHDPRLLYPSAMSFTEQHVLNFLQHILCPTKLIWAEQGITFPKIMIKQREQCINDLSTFSIPGGHHAHMDYPELVAKTFLNLN